MWANASTKGFTYSRRDTSQWEISPIPKISDQEGSRLNEVPVTMAVADIHDWTLRKVELLGETGAFFWASGLL